MRRRSSRIALLFALGAASASAAGAQASSPVALGARVRVQTDAADAARTVTGNLTGWENDTIAVGPAGRAEQRIPLAHVTRLDVSRGKGVVASHVLIGAGVGMLTGTLVGAAVGHGACDDCFVDALTTVTGAVVGASIGLVAGTIVGVAIKGERWRRVALERPAVSVAPLRGGGVAIAFFARF